ncbi:MAG: 16S rRNA (guanine(527)-N(7))-methyltransferase RsmG [Pyrinomonadaceae bacterium]
MREEFIHAIKSNQSAFGFELSDESIGRLAEYYDLVMEHNELLHLVAPCSPEEFAVRHILESLTLLEYLPVGAKFADVGAGAGLPSIPCLLVRNDLHSVLIESKEKKAKFLEVAIKNLGLKNKAEILNCQFEEADPTNCRFVTCRALDKFTKKLPRLIKWSNKRRMLLFGGLTLGETLQKCLVPFSAELMPMSRQRFLYVSDQS